MSGKRKTKDLPEGITLVTREEWRAKPPLNTTPLDIPVQYVRFTTTNSHPCPEKREDCIRIVQNIQKKSLNHLEEDDISYNFLIAGDGTVYEGRGWETEGERDEKYDFMKGKGIDIAYIGTFDKKIRPTKMAEKIAGAFVRYGVEAGYIQRNFKELSHRE